MTQVPTDLPDSVLAQLGNRVQHALRAFTPNDQKALRQAARTYPHTSYDLEELLTTLGTGEAVVTVLVLAWGTRRSSALTARTGRTTTCAGPAASRRPTRACSGRSSATGP